MTPLAHRMAVQMLGYVDHDGLPAGLAERIDRASELIARAKQGGEMVSSQALAVIVEAWERERGDGK